MNKQLEDYIKLLKGILERRGSLSAGDLEFCRQCAMIGMDIDDISDYAQWLANLDSFVDKQTRPQC